MALSLYGRWRSAMLINSNQTSAALRISALLVLANYQQISIAAAGGAFGVAIRRASGEWWRRLNRIKLPYIPLLSINPMVAINLESNSACVIAKRFSINARRNSANWAGGTAAQISAGCRRLSIRRVSGGVLNRVRRKL
jgi:hypothetical protein